MCALLAWYGLLEQLLADMPVDPTHNPVRALPGRAVAAAQRLDGHPTERVLSRPQKRAQQLAASGELLPEQFEAEGGGYVDMAAVLADPDNLNAPQPELGARTDGRRLFYLATVNVVWGPPESAKTWLALSTEVEVLTDGGSVLHVEADHNTAGVLAGRLRIEPPDPKARRPGRRRDRPRLTEGSGVRQRLPIFL